MDLSNHPMIILLILAILPPQRSSIKTQVHHVESSVQLSLATIVTHRTILPLPLEDLLAGCHREIINTIPRSPVNAFKVSLTEICNINIRILVLALLPIMTTA